jgi:hypothetical protein
MKALSMRAILYFIIALSVVISSQANAQVSSDMQAMHMIKDFYTAYCSLDLTLTNKSKLDSLINKYFTKEEGKRLKQAYKKGHDIMTSDSGITHRSLETMIIKTISNQKALDIETGKYNILKGIKDAYEVSYVVDPITPKLYGITEENAISVEIMVVKQDGIIKISYVTNGLNHGLQYRRALKMSPF